MKFNDKRLVSLDALRWMKLPERLMLFYDLFGYQRNGNGDAWFPCWADAEIAQVIGWMNPDGTPKGESIRQARTRLVQAGRLEKVDEEQQGRIFYTYRPSDGCKGLMEDEALKILSDKVRYVTFCRPGERGLLELQARIDNLPDILVAGLKGQRNWPQVLSDLLDLLNPVTLDFWEYKAPQALDARDHPLKAVEDKDLRLQVALFTLDTILTRNLKSNATWAPRNPIGWTLNALTRIGKENDWRVPFEPEKVQQWRQAQTGIPTLKDTARAAIEKVRATQSSSSGSVAGPQPVADPVGEAKKRHDIAAKRRSAAGRGGPESLHDAPGVDLDGDDDDAVATFNWDRFMTPTPAPAHDAEPDTWSRRGDDWRDPLDEDFDEDAGASQTRRLG